MAKIKGISNLSDAITQALTEYTNEVTLGIEKEKKDKGKKAVQLLKERSPKKSGKYAKGWRESDIDGKEVIFNKTDYQKTHLLEYGHAKINGGRVAAKPHIRPVEEEINNEFIEGVKKVIKG